MEPARLRKVRSPHLIVVVIISIILVLVVVVFRPLWGRTRAEMLPFEPVPESWKTQWQVCNNRITEGLEAVYERGIEERLEWGEKPFQWEQGKATRDKYMVASQVTTALPTNTQRFTPILRVTNPLVDHFSKFKTMGPKIEACAMKRVGSGYDEERFMCWKDSFDVPECLIYSIGSNNQWEFEEAVAGMTSHCQLHTWDCTVSEFTPPLGITDRVHAHSVCLNRDVQSENLNSLSFPEMVESTGGVVPTLLKIDIEGFEWQALMSIVASADEVLRETGRDVFPTQIAVELHQAHILPWTAGELKEEQLQAYFNRMFYQGGYVLSYGRYRFQCYFCAEVLFVRTMCRK